MASTPPTLRAIQTLGLSTSLLLSSFNLTLSTFFVPALLHSASTPATILAQWNGMYQPGKKLAPALSVTSALSYFYLAYQNTGEEWKSYSYAACGVLALGFPLYTLTVMGSTNGKLLGMVAGGMKGKEGDVRGLVGAWGELNLGRAGMVLVGGLVGAWTALS